MAAFLRIESYKKGIVFSTIFNLFSRALLFLQSVVIAYYFGASDQTDVYFYCYAAITLLSVFVNALDSSVLIPESMRLIEQKGKDFAMQFLNFFMFLYLGVCALICAIILINPVDTFLLFSNFDRNILEANLQILLMSAALFVLMIITNLLVSILASHKFFTIPTLAGMINNTLSLLFIVIFHNQMSISSLLVGLGCGYVTNIILLVFLMRSQLSWKFSYRRVTIEPTVRKNILYAMAGNITSTLSSYLPMYMLSGFGTGVIATMTYGQKTSEVPNQLITSQTSTVLGIKLNELYARNDLAGVDRVFNASIQFLLFIMVPVALQVFLFAESVVSILFDRGAFSSTAATSAAQFLQYFVVILPMLAINTVVSRLFMAKQKNREAFGYQVIFNLVLITFIYIGISVSGSIGFPLALIVVHTFNTLGCYFLLRAFFPEIRYELVLLSGARILALNAIPFLLLLYLRDALVDFHEYLGPVIGGTGYVVFVGVVNKYIRVNEEANAILMRIIGAIWSPFAKPK